MDQGEPNPKGVVSGYLAEETPSASSPRWRARTSGQAFAEEIFQQGVDAQASVGAQVIRRAKEIFHEYGHTVTGAQAAFRFLETAMQVWASPGERSLPDEGTQGHANAEGRGNDLQAFGDATAEEGISDPDR